MGAEAPDAFTAGNVHRVSAVSVKYAALYSTYRRGVCNASAWTAHDAECITTAEYHTVYTCRPHYSPPFRVRQIFTAAAPHTCRRFRPQLAVDMSLQLRRLTG